jgi:hypothetical protein
MSLIQMKAKKHFLVSSEIQVSELVSDVGISALLRSGHPLSNLDKQELVAQATLADVQVTQ